MTAAYNRGRRSWRYLIQLLGHERTRSFLLPVGEQHSTLYVKRAQMVRGDLALRSRLRTCTVRRIRFAGKVVDNAAPITHAPHAALYVLDHSSTLWERIYAQLTAQLLQSVQSFMPE